MQASHVEFFIAIHRTGSLDPILQLLNSCDFCGLRVLESHEPEILSFLTRNELVASVRRPAHAAAGRDFCGSGRRKPGPESQKTMTAESNRST